jgi:sphinganine-1-phosphate aldolase
MSEAASDPMTEFLNAMYPYRREFESFRAIPEEGVDPDALLEFAATMASREDAKGLAGRVSGSIYHGGEDHYAYLEQVFGKFGHANVLQRDMYPSSTKFEGEIVAMTAAMLHGEAVAQHHPGEEVCGVLTSGGTESLMNPMLVYRDWGRARGITRPRVIMPVTAHPAFDKGAHYFDIELVKAPVGPDFAVDVDWVADNIDDNTVALIGSAGNYPYGVIDPIGALSDIALERGINLHVDGCLGGFVLPWAEQVGRELPPFDFRNPGVTSISADTHKYGYALKGSSVLLYRNKELRKLQYFSIPNWPGGLYASPGMSGSRSGGIIAAAWAAMVTMGQSGYREIARGIFATADTIRAGVAAIPELTLLGNSPFMVAFGSDELDIFLVNDELAARGWRLNGLQHPAGVHFCVTRPNTSPGVAEAFVADLRVAVDAAKLASGPAKSGAVYALGAAPGGDDVITSVISSAIDLMYEVAPQFDGSATPA